jgi:hypothetical protein
MNEVKVLGRQGNPVSSPVRTLKIEDLGDPWRGKPFSGIRLKGRWLVNAGFHPGQRVTVIISAPGSMQLRIVPESRTAGLQALGCEQTHVALEFARDAERDVQIKE